MPCVTQHPVSKVDGFWYACCNIKDTFLWTDPRLSSFLLIFMICKDGQISMFLWAYVGYEIANHIPLLVFVVIVSRKGHERITLTFFAVFFAPRPPLSVSLSLSHDKRAARLDGQLNTDQYRDSQLFTRVQKQNKSAITKT